MARKPKRRSSRGRRERRAEPAVRTRSLLPSVRLPLWAGAVVLIQLGLMLSVFNPAAHNGGDTAGYVTLAHSLLERSSYTDLWQPGQPPHTKYPPFFPMLLAVAIALGARSWAALKVVPALFTTLSVAVTYLWARERRGPAFAAGVALLTAASNAMLWSSHWELSEPPFMALTFLSLWAYDRTRRPLSSGTAIEDRTTRPSRWLAVGAVAAGLAYFTRSAGLPLLVAAGVWLLIERRRRAAAVLAGGVGGLALLWSLRGGQGAQYLSEFWMVDPYQPDLGRVGIAGLLARALDNAVSYVTVHVPVGLLGVRGGAVALMGVALFGLGTWGWVRRLRRPGVAELFAPLYLGLILLWPQVWSGDRFALPLIPLLLFYAGEALARLAAPLAAGGRRLALGLAVAVIAAPALVSWAREVRVASGCAAAVRADGAFACWGARTTEFVQSALWSGAHLPDGAVVLSRKPRIFYVMSRVSSETFPFTGDADRFLAAADSLRARYLVMDYLDSAASVYVAQALLDQGGAFCALEAFGRAGDVPTHVLGIVPPEQRREPEISDEGDGTLAVAMRRCPEEMTRPNPLPVRSARSQQIPLLLGSR